MTHKLMFITAGLAKIRAGIARQKQLANDYSDKYEVKFGVAKKTPINRRYKRKCFKKAMSAIKNIISS